ncbi:MAG: septum formation initiator family protein [Ignavibacteriales bacterium]|jgi:cell division protein FtsL|nr:septum formation initiator family protein [Ignavibacteriaceae bacterium]NLH60384.1 septum formation initiator family protein [Ignavibacteriales bacterium]HOJ18871.1 septum formation initiator family protein [Ignavibacteriaceae bacterium]HPO56641.1 septum formation initiator family protein [Ignavibacteriaceae bacterium]
MATVRSKTDKKGKPWFLIIFIIAVAIAVFFIVFNQSGYIKYLKVKGEKEQLEKDTLEIGEMNKRLENEIDSLQRKEPAKIEKLAREKFNMSRPNERIIRVEKK